MGRIWKVKELAEFWSVSPGKILKWIRNGELDAVNLATTTATSKPVWRITEQAVENFMACRSVCLQAAPTRSPRTRKKSILPKVKEWF